MGILNKVLNRSVDRLNTFDKIEGVVTGVRSLIRDFTRASGEKWFMQATLD